MIFSFITIKMNYRIEGPAFKNLEEGRKWCVYTFVVLDEHNQPKNPNDDDLYIIGLYHDKDTTVIMESKYRDAASIVDQNYKDMEGFLKTKVENVWERKSARI